MKKLSKLFLFCCILFAAGALNATTTKVNVDPRLIEEDALVCTVYNSDGSRVGRCYFCNCQDFADAWCTCNQ